MVDPHQVVMLHRPNSMPQTIFHKVMHVFQGQGMLRPAALTGVGPFALFTSAACRAVPKRAVFFFAQGAPSNSGVGCSPTALG